MARSHHRKKHKEQLRQFKHKDDSIAPAVRTKASNIFTIVGAVIGSAVGYLVSHNSLVWAAIGLIVGIAAGYIIGRKADTGK
jgi:uncharacterized membrane protein YfcA